MKWLTLLLNEVWTGVVKLKPTDASAYRSLGLLCAGILLGILIGWKFKPSASEKKTLYLADTAFHFSENRYQQKVDSLKRELHQRNETIIDLREQMALDSVRRMSELEAMRTINERYRRR